MNLPSHPLTHHEILGLVGPFTRRGRHVDLAASDRIARRLVLKPIDHAGDDAGGHAGDPAGATPTTSATPGLRETLQLEHIDTETFRLTRVLTLANGQAASLQTEGPQPGDLLALIEAVPPQRQIHSGPGYVIAQSHRLQLDPTAAPGEAAATRLVLIQGVARVDGLTLTLEPPTVRGMLADLALVASAGEATLLPDDLLAVLGRDWSRLGEAAEGWRSSLRLRGGEITRSRNAEAKLEQAAAHLARCLAEPPARFHERLRSARWRVYGRRSIPLLASIALIAAAASVPKLNLAENSPWRMLIFNAPPLLMILVFWMRELPRIEIPPWPRPSAAAAWRTAPATTADAARAQARPTASAQDPRPG